jgi:glycerol transport system ATP-binding protein
MTLRLQSVQKRVGNGTHLYETALELERGLNVLLGPTLAGKTSLMRIMAGLDRPSSGRVILNGEDVTGKSVRKRNVAFVYQQFINYPSLTIFENIASPLRVRERLPNAAIGDRVRAAAEMMHIDHLLDRLPAQLSGGQQQRTAIARALVSEVKLLLLDEPLVNLDYKLREELRAELRDIFANRDTIVVYATTEPHEALLLGGTTVVLDRGQVLQSGPTLDMYHRPHNQRAAVIFSDPPMNLMAATVEGGSLRFSQQARAPLPPHMQGLAPGDYRIGVRPSHVELNARADGLVAMAAQVELAEISGSETYVHLEHREEGSEPVRVVAQLAGVHRYAFGQQATFYLDPQRFFVFESSGRLAAAPQPRSSAGSSGQRTGSA